MFFTSEEMKVAEHMAWKVFDKWNNADCHDYNDYAHFYYKDKVVLNPWLREDAQNLCCTDYGNSAVAVNPTEYYDVETIENYITRLFVLHHDRVPEIIERLKDKLDGYGRLIRELPYFPSIEVFIGMPQWQANEEYGFACVGPSLPESSRVYDTLENLPEDLVKHVKNDWDKEVSVPKKNLKKVMGILYPEGIEEDYYKYYVDRCYGKEIRLIGFGD